MFQFGIWLLENLRRRRLVFCFRGLPSVLQTQVPTDITHPHPGELLTWWQIHVLILFILKRLICCLAWRIEFWAGSDAISLSSGLSFSEEPSAVVLSCAWMSASVFSGWVTFTHAWLWCPASAIQKMLAHWVTQSFQRVTALISQHKKIFKFISISTDLIREV